MDIMQKTITIILLMIVMISCCLAEVSELDIMIGQMIMVGFRGMESNDENMISELIRKYHIGGIILFDYDVELKVAERNISSMKQVKKLTEQLQNAATIPLFIAIDQEGGRVARLKEKHGFPATLSAAALGELNDIGVTFKTGLEIGRTLQGAGINLNLAPVVDVNFNPDNPAIGRLDRSFSADPERVGRQAEAFIKGMREYNVLSCSKHFPGHGSAYNDSHYGMTDITSTWSEEELIPYRYLIQNAGIEMIMTGHLFHAELDNHHPATLSSSFLEDILREKLGFDGVIISDDMNMQAITNYYGLEEAVLLALSAGVDILLYANNMQHDPEIAATLHTYIKFLVTEGKISEERIRGSYERIISLKSSF